MTYYVGGNVQAQDYNSFATNGSGPLIAVNTLWGVGANSFGYGQTEIGTVSANAIVANTEWIALYNTIESIANHSGATITPITNPNDGDIIVAYDPVLPNNLANVNAARMNAVAQSPTSPYSITNTTNTWNDKLTFTWTIPFESHNAARYFFNCGGQIGLSFSHPAGSGYTINQLISSICSTIGTVWLSSPASGQVTLGGIVYEGVTKRGGEPDTEHPSNPVINKFNGFYSWNDTYQLCISQKVIGAGYGSGYGTYAAGTTLAIYAKYDGSGIVSIQAIIDQLPDPGPIVTTGTSSTCTIRPPETTYISNSWGGVITPAGVVTTSTEETLSWVTPSGSLTSGVTDVAYSSSVVATTTDSSAITYTLTSGELPLGLSLDPSGTITGTPLVVISKTFGITATSANTAIDPKTRSFTILVTALPAVEWVTPSGQLQDGETGVPYSVQLSAAANDSSTITYSVNSGSLPSGLSLDGSTGMLTGSPSAGGSTYTFVIRASSPTAGGIYADRTFSISVDATTIYFTPGSAYWIPTGVTSAGSVRTIGGGGSGAGGAVTGSGGGGSGGIGSLAIPDMSVVTKLSATVGIGGVAANNGSGAPGGLSTLEVYTGGSSPSSTSSAGAGLAPSDNSTTNFGAGGSPLGTAGTPGNQVVAGILSGGHGGATTGSDGTVYGIGGLGGTAGSAGVDGTDGLAGTGVGSGGGGGGNNAKGGNGAGGEVRVTYYQTPAKRIYVISNSTTQSPIGPSTNPQTDTTYTWNVPSGLKSLEVYLIGAGGGGSSGSSTTPAEGGGGGQVAYIDFTPIAISTLPSQITFNIGAGGRSRNGGVSPTTPSNATAGGSTSMTAGSLLSVTALGGLGGEDGGASRNTTLPANVSTSYWTINYYAGAATSGAGLAAKTVSSGGGGGGGSGNGGAGTAGGGNALGFTGKGGTGFSSGGDQRIAASSVVADTTSGAQSGGGGGGVSGNNATGGWGGHGKVIIVASTDPFNATARTMTATNMWSGLTYDEGASRFIATTSASRAVNYSSDGVTWSFANLPVWPGRPGVTYTGQYWCNLAYGNGKTVLSGVDWSAVTSDGGSTWALNQMPSQGAWFGCAYGAGKYVMAQAPVNSTSPTAVGLIAYSTNGTTWTQISIPAYNWYKLRFNNGLFTLVAYDTDKILTSPDGVNWTLRAMPGKARWLDSAYGAGVWVAVGRPSTGTTGAEATLNGAYSTDGVTWTRMQLPTNGYWISVSYTAGKFVAVGGGTLQSGNYAATSYDGINWVPQSLPVTARWTNTAAGNNKIVVVGGAYANNNTNTPDPTNQSILIE